MINSKTAIAFEKHFGRKPLMFIAPGRINLIGEHTDYNEGFVMPAAINKHFVFAIESNQTDLFNITANDLDEQISFALDGLKGGNRWENYLMGIVDSFKRRGRKMGGVNCLFSSGIPSGAGLSSSAALCSGFAFALNEIFECGLSKLELALIAQEAEHRFAGTKCGIMDMYASLFSKEGSVMLLDCRSNTHEYLPVHFEGFEILLIDTKVRHSLNESGYNDRRASCEEGVAVLQRTFANVKSLRDVNAEMLEASKSLMSENIFKKCFYIVREIERTQKAAILLKSNDLTGFGNLMYETHWGLSKDYDVSCEESDWLVNWASENRITGARQMGGGFGGCTINLIKKELRPAIIDDVRKKYFAAFKKEPDFYQVELSGGVHKTKTVLDWRER
ncbi:MAG: galactokinase [Bacteroidetes bacterium]|nr:galactokinase [Bacteroidota bacterium]MBI3482383.1 galactokinase [Bacteroidota bacterium]